MNFLHLRALMLRTSLGMLAISMASWAISLSPANAGVYHWGTLSDSGADVMFLDVEEDNGYSTSLFAPEPGVGAPMAVGNSLVLDPQNFLSQTSGGSDVVDSEFSTTLMVNPGNSINSIEVDEFGDFTLGGLPMGLATAQVGATFYWQVLELDGVATSLPLQVESMQVSTGLGPNGGIYLRPGHDGITTPWEGSAMIDVAGYLDANLISGSATKVSLLFNNTLLTASDPLSSAFIKKKGVEIHACVEDPFHVIPEPTSIALLGLGLSLCGLSRKRPAN